MKLGIAAADTPKWPKIDWVVDAAQRLGHDVRRTTSGDELPSLLRECDLVILGHKSISGRWPNVRKAIESRQCPVVYWWFDLVATQHGMPIGEQPLFQSFAQFFRASDLCLVKERSLLDEYKAAGCTAAWFDQGCPSTLSAVKQQEPEWDMLVWGQVGHYNERSHAATTALRNGFTVAWAGGANPPKGCVQLPWTPAVELPQLASRARCVLSCGVRNDVEGFWSDQFWLATGMGACVIRRATPGLPDGPYLTYRQDSQICDMLSWSQKFPDDRLKMGRDARTWTMDHHTIEKRVKSLLELTAHTVMARGFRRESCTAKA